MFQMILDGNARTDSSPIIWLVLANIESEQD